MGPAAILAGAGLLGKLFGGTAKGSADERGNQNNYGLQQNQQALSQFNTQQNALLQSILAGGRDSIDRYQTQQGATTSALGNQSQEATGRYGIQQGATTTALGNQSQEGLQRARLGMDSGTARARQSIMGSLMANMQPVSVQAQGQVRGRVPVISGGLSASALSPETRQHGAELSKAALMAQLTGSDVPAATDFKGGILNAPAATDFRSGILDAPAATDYSKGIMAPPNQQGYQKAGKVESIMSLLSTILGGAGAVGQAKYGTPGSIPGIPFDTTPPPPPGYRG